MFLSHPAMLAWLALAVGPLVIHLLNRGSVKSVDWAAMMFLPPAGSAGDYRSRLKQWTLLVVRTLIVAAVAVAMARPVVSTDWPLIPAPAATGPATVAVVLDTSPAMDYAVNGRSRFELARAAVLQLLAAVPAGGRVGLLTTDGRAHPPTTDVQSIATVVAELRTTSIEADVRRSIQRAARWVNPPEGKIVVVTDRRAATWKTPESPAGLPLPPVLVARVGGIEASQLALESVRVLDPMVVRNRPTAIEVRVRNLGPSAQPAVPLLIWSGVRDLVKTTVAVPAGQTRTIRFAARFPDAGPGVLSAAVKGPGLTADQRADVAVSVFDTVRVAVRSDRPDTALRFALAPFAVGAKNDFTIVPADDLTKADVLILDSAVSTDAMARDIERFVLEGGGLWVTPVAGGWPLSPGFLPATFGLFAGSSVLSSVDRQDPSMRFLSDRPLPAVRLFRRSQLTPVDRPVVLATADDGSPVLVRSAAGRGHIVASAVSFSAEDSDLTTTELFLPLMQSVVADLAQGHAVDRNLEPNTASEIELASAVEDRSVTFQRLPAGPRDALTVVRSGPVPRARLPRLDPGLYRLRYRLGGRERSDNYVVRQTEGPPDLTPVNDDPKELAGMPSLRVVDASDLPTAAFDRTDGPRELWPDLVAAAAMLLGVESLLARRWA